MGQKCNEKSVLCPHSIHPFIHSSIHPSILLLVYQMVITYLLIYLLFIQNSGLFALFSSLFFFFLPFFLLLCNVRKKHWKFSPGKYPLWEPTRRRFRKVLEGSSIYSFEASKMPPPPPRREGVGCHRFPKPNNYSLSHHQSKIFLLWKSPKWLQNGRSSGSVLVPSFSWRAYLGHNFP